MKPERAIEILTLSKTCEFEGSALELEEAHQLGIEALKRVNSRPHQPLPGETKE